MSEATAVIAMTTATGTAHDRRRGEPLWKRLPQEDDAVMVHEQEQPGGRSCDDADNQCEQEQLRPGAR